MPAQNTGFVPQGKFIIFWLFFPYNKSFIDQACSVKMAGYWPCSVRHGPFTRKKELDQYPVILTSRLVNNPYILQSFLYFLRVKDINKDINQFPKGTRGNIFQSFRENVQTQVISFIISFNSPQKLFSTLGVVRNDFF